MKPAAENHRGTPSRIRDRRSSPPRRFDRRSTRRSGRRIPHDGRLAADSPGDRGGRSTGGRRSEHGHCSPARHHPENGDAPHVQHLPKARSARSQRRDRMGPSRPEQLLRALSLCVRGHPPRPSDSQRSRTPRAARSRVRTPASLPAVGPGGEHRGAGPSANTPDPRLDRRTEATSRFCEGAMEVVEGTARSMRSRSLDCRRERSAAPARHESRIPCPSRSLSSQQ